MPAPLDVLGGPIISKWEAAARLLDLEGASKWYCEREECDGEPHDRWVWCTHPPGQHESKCRHARTKQRPPKGDWFIWLLQTGRGFGKGRSCSEWLAHEARNLPESEWVIIAPTHRMLTRVCVDGPSGIRRALKRDDPGHAYNKQDMIITLTNGSRIYLESSTVADRVRGLNLNGAWCDELSSWKKSETWYEALIPAVRIGDHPKIAVSTTPKPVGLIKDLNNRKDGSVVIVTGHMSENASNLSSRILEEMERRYAGTRLGRQEIAGELIEELQGALWTYEIINHGRVERAPENLIRVVVGVDPAVSSGEDADSTGIIVAAKDGAGHAYILEDHTQAPCQPEAWAQAVVRAYHKWSADRVVAEVNNGGDMIPTLIAMVDKSVPVETVHATRGKIVRAEPISAAYAKGIVHHVGVFDHLEAEMCGYTNDPTLRSREINKSPDRMDAMVWALTALNIQGGSGWHKLYEKVEEKPEEVLQNQEVVRARTGWGSVYR